MQLLQKILLCSPLTRPAARQNESTWGFTAQRRRRKEPYAQGTFGFDPQMGVYPDLHNHSFERSEQIERP